MLRLICAAAVAALFATSATAQEKFVRIVHVETGKVLAVADDSDEAGARTVLAKLDEKNKAQQWEVKKDDKHFSLVNR
ncbi:MAG: RICIN domain-containing protein, partial [Gemmataceae bacterium]|nr:RICIN domain-containing protein [Gemmataceae bacterium]